MKIQKRISKKLRAVTNPSFTPGQEIPAETERSLESRYGDDFSELADRGGRAGGARGKI